jgi:hypothetical protein
MNVAELRDALENYPDDMPVAVVDQHGDDLDPDACLDIAIDYGEAGFRPNGRNSWAWSTQAKPEHADRGVETLVIY